MKIRKATRITAQFPGQTGVWFGTCPVWMRDIPAEATVKVERVMVVNPTRVPCFVPTCGGVHIAVANPNN